MTSAPDPRATHPPAVELRGVDVRYGDIHALTDAHLAVGRGRVCGLVGRNGAGKTTLLIATLGLVAPTKGTVRLEGRDPAAARRAGAIAYVPQGDDVDWDFPVSVRDVVAMGRFGHQGALRRESAKDGAAITAALDRVGLTDLAERQIGALSGGQRKRAFVARAIAQDARILLLDEPFAGVDGSTQAELTRLLRELAAAGATALISTHDLAAAPDLCDEVALVAGTVLRHGPPLDVLRPELLAEAFGVPVTPLPDDGASPPTGDVSPGDGASRPTSGATPADDGASPPTSGSTPDTHPEEVRPA